MNLENSMLGAAYKILQTVARSLGYDYTMLRLEASSGCCRYICVFGRYAYESRQALMYENEHAASIDMFTDDGKTKSLADVYEEFTRKLY